MNLYLLQVMLSRWQKQLILRLDLSINVIKRNPIVFCYWIVLV